MPPHIHVTTCLKEKAPCSAYCSCYHCTLSVCAVCGAYEGGLTTDCPDAKVTTNTTAEVYTNGLDYTDCSGWMYNPYATPDPHFAVPYGPPKPTAYERASALENADQVREAVRLVGLQRFVLGDAWYTEMEHTVRRASELGVSVEPLLRTLVGMR